MSNKKVFILGMLLFVSILLCSCSSQRAYKKSEGEVKTDGIYEIGSKGPADGYVFYDCDADNASGNADGLISSQCGWRYLEASPIDLYGLYMFGSDGICWTEEEIGSGRSNTEKIIEDAKRKEEPTTPEDVLWGDKVSAAVACSIFSINGYSDWFLPSVEELRCMYNNLKSANKGFFETSGYWTSSENGDKSAWMVSFKNGYQVDNMRNYNNHVRPVRAFK